LHRRRRHPAPPRAAAARAVRLLDLPGELMAVDWNSWLILVVRWVHIFASILWVGTTYYFTWLDGRFTELAKGGDGGAAGAPQIWMVHSGGFYRVEKTKAYDATL